MCLDLAAAKNFYGQLFGWQSEDQESPGGTYSLLSLEGQSVGALAEMPDDMREQDIPPHWQVYLFVDDLEQTLAKIHEHGGGVCFGPRQLGQKGRFASCFDPHGAHFQVWQPLEQKGAERCGKDGGLAWCELMTTQVESALEFYQNVFGWSHTSMPLPEGAYYLMSEGADRVTGAMALPPGAPMPPCWLVYFQVPDLAASLDRAKELGATLMMPETPVPGFGSFAFLADPQQAFFYLWKSA